MRKVCSVFGDTVIGSSRYSGSITWLPSVNLPFSVSRASLSIPPLGLDSVEVVFSPSVSGEFIDSNMLL